MLQLLHNTILKFGGQTKEFELMSYLQNHHAEFYLPLGDSPSLFKKHFWLFHHLYLLNKKLNESGEKLFISALDIRLSKIDNSTMSLSDVDPLQGFYLDDKNLLLTDEEIAQMQQKFWQKYLALDQKADAIKTLELTNESNLSLDKVKTQFKKLAKKHHPDKGGDAKKFNQIKQAFDSLSQIVK